MGCIVCAASPTSATRGAAYPPVRPSPRPDVTTWDAVRSNPITGPTTLTDSGGMRKKFRAGDSVQVPIVRAVLAVRRSESTSLATAPKTGGRLPASEKMGGLTFGPSRRWWLSARMNSSGGRDRRWSASDAVVDQTTFAYLTPPSPPSPQTGRRAIGPCGRNRWNAVAFMPELISTVQVTAFRPYDLVIMGKPPTVLRTNELAPSAATSRFAVMASSSLLETSVYDSSTWDGGSSFPTSSCRGLSIDLICTLSRRSILSSSLSSSQSADTSGASSTTAPSHGPLPPSSASPPSCSRGSASLPSSIARLRSSPTKCSCAGPSCSQTCMESYTPHLLCLSRDRSGPGPMYDRLAGDRAYALALGAAAVPPSSDIVGGDGRRSRRATRIGLDRDASSSRSLARTEPTAPPPAMATS
mmetsp:Transcript_255/g.658  ORF Transcript_255/g.658 Transcript_255/m.658 type:complete len:413 (+) Transcript_255:394-1632(+)